MKRSLIVLTLSAAALLAGCAANPPAAALYDFGLATAAPAAASVPPLPALIVADIGGPSWLDSQNMYYRLLYADPQQARPYANSHWNAAPLQLLSQRLRTRMAQAGVKVLAATDAATGVTLLRVEIDEFAQHFDTPQHSSGRLTLRASLLRGHRLIDQRSFSHTSPAASADAAGGAGALAATADAVAADLLGWITTLPPQKE